MKATTLRLIRALLALIAVTAAFATSAVPPSLPRTVHYQGFLTASSGAPVSASLSMMFRLYASAVGGSPIWSETRTVAVSNGVYDVDLGTESPLPGTFDQPYHLGVSVGADPEMTPRQPLASVPYAITAGMALEVAPGAVTQESIGIACATGQTLKYTLGVGWGCGSIECGPGTMPCDGTCIDVQSDRSNCGFCGFACDSGKVCSNGSCVFTCQLGLLYCPNGCRNVATDTYNCGACENVCPAGRICSAGSCVLTCQAGLTICSGMCTNLMSDTDNCAACGNVCPAGTGCRAGACL
jgi:hypothetical protein